MLILELPFPPSANSYIRHSNNRRYHSPAGKRFIAEVTSLVEEIKKTRSAPFWRAPEGLLEVSIALHAPNKRSYDADNRIKPCLDVLTKVGVWVYDSVVARVTAERREIVKGGLCVAYIREYEYSKTFRA